MSSQVSTIMELTMAYPELVIEITARDIPRRPLLQATVPLNVMFPWRPADDTGRNQQPESENPNELAEINQVGGGKGGGGLGLGG
jgi:hypothetical protein